MLKYIAPTDRPLFFTLVAILILMLIIPWGDFFFPRAPVPGEGEKGWSREDTLNVLTAALVFSTILLWRATEKAARRNDSTIRTAERAYVKMSHVSPGIKLGKSGELGIQLQITNFGRTPARVVDAVIKFGALQAGSALPRSPDYIKEAHQLATKAFLVTNDYVFITVERIRADLSPLPLEKILNGSFTLVVYGYVEYEDAFRTKHRAGYARYYEPINDDRDRYATLEAYSGRSNLSFITSDEYNYDREIGSAN